MMFLSAMARSSDLDKPIYMMLLVSWGDHHQSDEGDRLKFSLR
jgi:hypothetical protein